jgi:hypothetical protein
LRLIIRTDAEADIASGYGWYEEQRRGLGTDFLEEVSYTLAAIGSNPRRFQLFNPLTRRAILRRFPYGIYFFVFNEIVLVAAVIHLARDPQLIDQRIR